MTELMTTQADDAWSEHCYQVAERCLAEIDWTHFDLAFIHADGRPAEPRARRSELLQAMEGVFLDLLVEQATRLRTEASHGSDQNAQG